MLIDTIQAELVRLQLHPVNLGAAAKEGGLVALEGSLMRYWTIPPLLDGQWLFEVLRDLPDNAGPEAVMTALSAAQAAETPAPQTIKAAAQLKLFDSAPHA